MGAIVGVIAGGIMGDGVEGLAVGVNRVMLLVSVVLGVLAMLLAFIYLSTAGGGEAQAADTTQNERQAEIVQVVRDLPIGHKLRPDSDLQKIAVPRDTFSDLVQSAVPAAEMGTLDGRTLGLPATAGQPLTYAHFAVIKDIELSGTDRRAYAVEVSGAAALQGLLVPGDRIDLVVMRPKQAEVLESAGVNPEDLTAEQTAQLAQAQLGNIFNQMARELGGRDGFEAEIVLENVKVLAVGNSLVGSRLSVVGQTRARQQRSDMITLDVSIEEALMLAEESSYQFRVLLRPKPRPNADDADTGSGGMSGGMQSSGG